jgi:glutamine synthetase adenylyltransferase
MAIRTPDLVDELELSGLRRRKNASEILDDLRHGREDADQKLWLRRYHQSEFMRLGLRDILGLADFEQNLTELLGAGGCLSALRSKSFSEKQMQNAPFAIIGLGKLGGRN